MLMPWGLGTVKIRPVHFVQAEAEGGDPRTQARRGEGADRDLEAVLAWCRQRAMLQQLTIQLEVPLSPLHV